MKLWNSVTTHLCCSRYVWESQSYVITGLVAGCEFYRVWYQHVQRYGDCFASSIGNKTLLSVRRARTSLKFKFLGQCEIPLIGSYNFGAYTHAYLMVTWHLGLTDIKCLRVWKFAFNNDFHKPRKIIIGMDRRVSSPEVLTGVMWNPWYDLLQRFGVEWTILTVFLSKNSCTWLL